jgi:hypothetical protein
MFQKLFPIILSVLAASVGATTIFQTGIFTADDQVEVMPFTLTARSMIDAHTTSHASGGFDPTLALFDSDGLQSMLDVNEDAGPGMLDSSLHNILHPGDYLLSLTESPNLAIGPTF